MLCCQSSTGETTMCGASSASIIYPTASCTTKDSSVSGASAAPWQEQEQGQGTLLDGQRWPSNGIGAARYSGSAARLRELIPDPTGSLQPLRTSGIGGKATNQYQGQTAIARANWSSGHDAQHLRSPQGPQQTPAYNVSHPSHADVDTNAVFFGRQPFVSTSTPSRASNARKPPWTISLMLSS